MLLQSHNVERIQKRALRIIVPHLKYEEALTTFKLTSLKERQEKHFVKLIKQMSDPSHNFNYLLPEKSEMFAMEELDMTVINSTILDVELNVLKIAL